MVRFHCTTIGMVHRQTIVNESKGKRTMCAFCFALCLCKLPSVIVVANSTPCMPFAFIHSCMAVTWMYLPSEAWSIATIILKLL